MKKKELKLMVESLQEELTEVQNRNADLEVWHVNNKKKIEESETWRAMFEQSKLTPEYKLDAEKAFNRGVTHTQEKVKTYLFTVVNSLFLEPLEKPDIKSWL